MKQNCNTWVNLKIKKGQCQRRSRSGRAGVNAFCAIELHLVWLYMHFVKLYCIWSNRKAYRGGRVNSYNYFCLVDQKDHITFCKILETPMSIFTKGRMWNFGASSHWIYNLYTRWGILHFFPIPRPPPRISLLHMFQYKKIKHMKTQ